MPCDGVTVLKLLSVKFRNDLLVTNEGLTAVKNWFKSQGVNVQVNPVDTRLNVSVPGGRIEIMGNRISCYGDVAPGLVSKFQAFLEKLTGYLKQEEIKKKVAALCQVDSVVRAQNGAIVMEVRI